MLLVMCGSVAHAAAAPGPEQALQFRVRVPITALAVSPDGKQLAVGTHGGDRLLWEAAERRFLARHRETDYGIVHKLLFARDGKSLLVSTIYRDGFVMLADGRTVRPTSKAAKLPRAEMLVLMQPLPAISDVRTVRASDLKATASYASDI